MDLLVVLAWVLVGLTALRVSSLLTSAFWITLRGTEFAEARDRAPELKRHDTEYLWSEILRLGGGPRPWRPFGVRSQLLEVAAIRAKRGKRGLRTQLLRLVRLAWRWQVVVLAVSTLTIAYAFLVADRRPDLALPLGFVVMLLLVGSISIAWEAFAADGNLGSWGWTYHRFPSRRRTAGKPDNDKRTAGKAESWVATAAFLVAVITIAQAQFWAALVVAGLPPGQLDPVQFWSGPVLALFGANMTAHAHSWIGIAIELGIIATSAIYVFVVLPLARNR